MVVCIHRDWFFGTLRSVLNSLRRVVGVRKGRSMVGALGVFQGGIDDLQNKEAWV